MFKNYSEKYFYDNFDKGRIPIIPKEIKIKSIKLVVAHIPDVDVNVYLNQIRTDDDVMSRARSLGISFENGIDWEQPLPIIKLREDGSSSLIDAFGRFEMFEINNQRYWLMVQVECDEKNEILLRGWANRQTYRLESSMKDNIELISEMVRKGFIKKTEFQYKKQLNIIEPHKTKEEKSEIIKVLVDKFGSTTKPKKKRFVSYTAATIMLRWVNKHFADAKRLGFKLGKKGKPAFSKISNCYFGILQYGYESRKILQAIAFNLKKDVPLKVLGLSDGKITGVKKLKKQRTAIKRNITRITNNIDNLYKKYNGNVPWDEVIDIFGFVPESVNEDVKEPVDYKGVK